MTHRRLLQSLEGLDCADDYVTSAGALDPLTASWLDAEDDAIAAYDAWSRDRDQESYAVYRAYADQADAAQDALAAASGRAIA
jgi:hypothetical protein